MNIKKGDFVRTTFAPNVLLCIDEEVFDLDDTKETYFWTTDDDGGEWEVALEEIEEVIPAANNDEGVKNHDS
jgi:hypothetical protein